MLTPHSSCFPGKPRNPSELSRDQAPNFDASQQRGENSSSSDEESSKEEEPKDGQIRGRDEPSTEGAQQPRNRVPATLSISHILSGASRDDRQHHEERPSPSTQQGPVATPQGTHSMPHAAARQVMGSPPDNKDRLTPSNEHFNRVPGKAPFENITGRSSSQNAHGRAPYGIAPDETVERAGPYGDPRRQNSYEQAFVMKFNDRKHLSNVAESVIKKAPQNTASELSAYKKMPELRPMRETSENEPEEKQVQGRTLKSVSENGHLEPAKTDTVGQRMPGDLNKHLKEGGPRGASYKAWPDLQLDSVTPGGFLQELNDIGPPSGASFSGEKPGPDKNNRLPFTSMLRGMSPSPANPAESRSQYLTLDAASRERMRENMMMGNFLRSPEEKHNRFNPAARGGDMSAYMHGNKRPSDMMPPALQYRPNLSAMAHQRKIESPDMPSGANSQFVDLNSMQYRGYPSGLPGSREALSREQMYYLQQQRRQQMASSMEAMMAGGQPERIMGYDSMLRQQQLFNAAYASHMRNGEFPGFPSEGERQYHRVRTGPGNPGKSWINVGPGKSWINAGPGKSWINAGPRIA